MDAIAQAVAFLLRDRKVPGSNPVGHTFFFIFFIFQFCLLCFNPFRGRRHYSGALFFLSFFFTASIVWALGRSNLFRSNTRCLGKRFLSWKFRVALYTISYKQLKMKKCKDFKLNSVMKSFYPKMYWYLVYGRFKGRWLRIQYQILQIQNSGSNMAAWS